jgi:hypothetical protein
MCARICDDNLAGRSCQCQYFPRFYSVCENLHESAYVRISVIGEIDPHRPIIADKALTARGSPGFTGRGRVVGRYLSERARAP